MGEGMSGKPLVILFAVFVVGAAIASTIVMERARGDAHVNQAGIGVMKVHHAFRKRAEASGGKYPLHVALLWSDAYFRSTLLRDPRQIEGAVWTVAGVDARPYLDERRDDVKEPDRLDRAPLIAAVESVRHEAFYRLGDYWFARLPRATGDGALVFGWTFPDHLGRRSVVFDDGEARRIEAADWPAVWRSDAEARRRHDLPAAAPVAD
jgi:hypothetical protein